ncbi:MAG TPA: hypothetical protein VL333_13235 [Candidatus Saccharimonadales bacterium]|jgi:hypothetical protein|nr:hypothetical protein [Candidatus Saccharimonadales bacterium]
MKLSQIKTKTIQAANAAALDTAITAFIETQTEATFLDLQYIVDGGSYSVIIVYTN